MIVYLLTMSAIDEESRAAAYRAQVQRRAAYRRAQLQRLAGSPAAAQSVRNAWQPVADWLTEREPR